MEVLDRLTAWLKSRSPGFPERVREGWGLGGASGLGWVSPGSSSSLHFEDEDLVVLCIGGGVSPSSESGVSPPPPGHCECTGRKPSFLREIKEFIFQRAGTMVKK